MRQRKATTNDQQHISKKRIQAFNSHLPKVKGTYRIANSAQNLDQHLTLHDLATLRTDSYPRTTPWPHLSE
ncbi:hypothetical protein VTK56DRAFT_1571 [Thermocarpiscus australiensis]